MTSPKVIAVTGATGTEGGAVARAAARQPLHRSPPRPRLIDGTASSLAAAGAQSVVAAMESPDSLGRASSKVTRAAVGLVLSAAAFVYLPACHPNTAPGAPQRGSVTMSSTSKNSDPVAADPVSVVRRNTFEVQGGGDWELFDQLFAADFIDHTPQPGFPADRAAVKGLYQTLRRAFPDFRAEIHFQFVEEGGDRVTTYKTYYGTHTGTFMGRPPTGRQIHFETVDVMRVRNGKITEHWGVGNLFLLAQQIGLLPEAGLDGK